MTHKEIIAKAITELQWAEAKLAAVGYPGVGEVEAAVKNAIVLLRAQPDAEKEPSKEPAPTIEPSPPGAPASEEEPAGGSQEQKTPGVDGKVPLSVLDELMAKPYKELQEIAKEYGVPYHFRKNADIARDIAVKAGYTIPDPATPEDDAKPAGQVQPGLSDEQAQTEGQPAPSSYKNDEPQGS